MDGLASAPALGLTTVSIYDGLGNRKEITDPEGRTTSFELRRARAAAADARTRSEQETSATYLGDGLKASETDRRGVKRLFDLRQPGPAATDPPRRGALLRRVLEPGDAVRRRPEAPADRDRRPRQDDHVRPRRPGPRREGDGRRSASYRTFTWDGVNKVEETDKRPAHHETAFEYDGINRLTKITDPAPFDIADGRDDVRRRAEPGHGEGPPRHPEAHADRPARTRRERHAGGRARPRRRSSSGTPTTRRATRRARPTRKAG